MAFLDFSEGRINSFVISCGHFIYDVVEELTASFFFLVDKSAMVVVVSKVVCKRLLQLRYFSIVQTHDQKGPQ